MNTEKIKKLIILLFIGCIVPLGIIAYAFYNNDRFQIFVDNFFSYFFLSCVVSFIFVNICRIKPKGNETPNKQAVKPERAEEPAYIYPYNQKLFYSKISGSTSQPCVSNPEKTTVEKELEKIDAMSANGYEFEMYVKKLLEKHGFNTGITQASNDCGVDVIAINKDGVRYAIQCKCYSSTVGNSAVQEVIAGMNIYSCQVAVVLTNSYFTSSAKKLAAANKVLLWDRDVLRKLISEQ